MTTATALVHSPIAVFGLCTVPFGRLSDASKDDSNMT
ncbi:putative membrane protein [Duffyella gerundensis]|uniref:Putative membrane protein n=1 Tax=Duffyella gerundensis TaxID=1619313 RepID=A0A0U5GN79_9GAMM|nr:putative membrane protein [Duffyella gerundensis]